MIWAQFAVGLLACVLAFGACYLILCTEIADIIGTLVVGLGIFAIAALLSIKLCIWWGAIILESMGIK